VAWGYSRVTASQALAEPQRFSLQTYRDAFPARWTLYWLLVPNLAIILMWFVGGVPMTPALSLFGLAALVVAQVPWAWAKRLALAAMIFEISYYYVCALFNLDTHNVAMLPAFVAEVRPLRSPEYFIAGAIFAASTAVSLVRAPRVPRFRTPMAYLLGFAMVFAFVVTDFEATRSTRGTYHATAPGGAPFVSATERAGVTAPSATRRNLVIIVVEALGVPTDQTARGLFEQAWDRPRWRSRYDVRRGIIPYYGSTTNGEIRELCGRWSNYETFDFAHADCLPARYARAGYETSAYHGFGGSFFDREHWYPEIGFQHQTFEPGLAAMGAKECAGVFSGTCDEAVPPVLAARIKRARKPQLIYWMTLSTHLPIIADSSAQTDDCRLGSVAWAEANPQVCRLFLLHRRLADAIDSMAMAARLPPTDFLIVGDHLPPFFDRDARLKFDNAHVPWFFLRAHGGVAKEPTAH
jgi:hypothetical protein